MKLPFDEVYLLNLVERQDKYEKMIKRIDYMGWDVINFRAVKHPIYDKIIQKLSANLGGNGYVIINSGVFGCTTEHYTIIKSAYLRGLNTVAIMEDDCSFIKDFSIWEEHLNNLPEDWNILRINCLRSGYEEKISNLQNNYWFKQPKDIQLWGTGFYVLNRKGMEYMINEIDKLYQPIDHPLCKCDYGDNIGINIYLPKIELSLCIEPEINKSDIRKKTGICQQYYKGIKRFKREDYI